VRTAIAPPIDVGERGRADLTPTGSARASGRQKELRSEREDRLSVAVGCWLE